MNDTRFRCLKALRRAIDAGLPADVIPVLARALVEVQGFHVPSATSSTNHRARFDAQIDSLIDDALKLNPEAL